MAFEKGGAQDELAAAAAGFGVFYERVAVDLGSLSDAAARIEAAQATVEKSQANAMLLRSVVDLLPHATGRWQDHRVKSGYDVGVFQLNGNGQQYAARQIQASVLWYPEGEIGIFASTEWIPCYMLGRRVIDNERDAELLLVPASGMQDPDAKGYYPPRIVTVRKDDLAARDQLAIQLQNKEFGPAAIPKMVNPVTGLFVVNSISEGSIVLEKYRSRHSSPEVVARKGVRHDPDKTKILRGGVSDEQLEQFEVDRVVPVLAAAFHETDNVRILLASDAPQPLLTREHRFADQNNKLRAELGRIMMAASGGILTQRQVNQYLDEHFPRI